MNVRQVQHPDLRRPERQHRHGHSSQHESTRLHPGGRGHRTCQPQQTARGQRQPTCRAHRLVGVEVVVDVDAGATHFVNFD